MFRTRLWLAPTFGVLGVLALAIGPAALASAAPDVRSTSVPGLTSLNSVWCPTAKTCVSVGSNADKFVGKSAVINATTGAVRAWSGSVKNDLFTAMACLSKTTCLAVSDDAVATVKVSNGALKVTATPKPPAKGIVALGAIACAGSKNCYAGGFEGSGFTGKALLIHLSSGGKLLGHLTPPGTGIAAIACPSSSRCLFSLSARSGETIQLLKNGRTGTSHAMPSHTYVEAIACYAAKTCYALGGNNSSTFTNELFPLNPATGAIGKVIKLGKFTGTDLTCATARRCLVIGFAGASVKAKVLAVVGGKAGQPSSIGSGSDGYSGIACATSSVCYAVGSGPSGAIVTKI
jgi:hypothetical protein